MFRELSYLLYNSITNPRSIFENSSENIKHSIFIFALSQFCVAIGFMNVLTNKIMPFSIIAISIVFILYFALLNLINIMIINTAALFSSKYRNGKNARVFLCSVFNASAVFILILPASLLLSFVGGVFYKSLMYIIYLAMNICYIYILIKIVKNNFEVKSNSNALIIIATPAIISFLHFFIFIIFYSSLIINIVIG